MQVKAPKKQAKYLYAVIASAENNISDITGIKDSRVHTIENNGLTAVVSNVKSKRIRPERRNLAAHQRVLTSLNSQSTPLPVTFGIVAKSSASIKKILGKNQKTLTDTLSVVDGKVEMILKVHWNVTDIFAHSVKTHPELKRLRDSYYKGRRRPNREEKIGLGQLFEKLLDDDRNTYADQVEKAISGTCETIRRQKCKDERMVMHFACLIDRKKEKDFEKAVRVAAKGFDNKFNFDYSGPWVAHSFVDIYLEI